MSDRDERLSTLIAETAGDGDVAFYLARRVRAIEDINRQLVERIGKLEFLLQAKDRQISELLADLEGERFTIVEDTSEPR